ncbi:MAG: hypothetical protein J7L96_04185 [Bacteroidales bacterium]|nr:hypothetical protein [Bacteroidales bacterium]
MATLAYFNDIKEFRQFAKGWDASNPLDELLPSYRTAKSEVVNLIGQATWDLLKSYHEDPPAQADADKVTAVEFIQAALANLTMFEHFIFVDIKKKADDGSLYRYQYDEVTERYIQNTWAALNDLLVFLDSKTDKFTDYASSPTYADRQDLIVTNAREFHKYYGIDNSAYFFSKLTSIIREVIDDELNPRIESWDNVKDDADLALKVKRALVYHTMSLALERFDFRSLPRTIRTQLANESIKTSRTAYSEDNARRRMSASLKDKALEYYIAK